jgi:hypothetical protein
MRRDAQITAYSVDNFGQNELQLVRFISTRLFAWLLVTEGRGAVMRLLMMLILLLRLFVLPLLLQLLVSIVEQMSTSNRRLHHCAYGAVHCKQQHASLVTAAILTSTHAFSVFAGENTSHHASINKHHTSHITHHTPHITHHTSHITHHTSHITKQHLEVKLHTTRDTCHNSTTALAHQVAKIAAVEVKSARNGCG